MTTIISESVLVTEECNSACMDRLQVGRAAQYAQALAVGSSSTVTVVIASNSSLNSTTSGGGSGSTGRRRKLVEDDKCGSTSSSTTVVEVLVEITVPYAQFEQATQTLRQITYEDASLSSVAVTAHSTFAVCGRNIDRTVRSLIPAPSPPPLPPFPSPPPSPPPPPLPPPPSPPCTVLALTNDFSLVTLGDAVVGSHAHYGGFAIGGVLKDASPMESATVQRPSWVNSIDGPAQQTFRFHAGVTTGGALPFDWGHFEYLATHVDHSPPTAFVVNQGVAGGTFTLNDFLPYGQPNTATSLVIFVNTGLVRITATADGRQFGPSILAPFAQVDLDGSVGFVEGFVVARSFSTSGPGASSLQLHGRGFQGGELTCRTSPGNTPEATIYAQTTSCVDRIATRKCTRKSSKGKCHKKKARKKCQRTCGLCPVG